MTVTGRHFETSKPVTLTIADGRIDTIQPAPDGTETDLWIAPGFIDIQVNGYGGADFNLSAWGAAEEVCFDPRAIVARLAAAGTTRLLPTITTNAVHAMESALSQLVAACDTDIDLASAVIGFHVEGPFLSPDDGPRGAHPKEHIQLPSWDVFQRLQWAALGRIRLVTLAPELPGALPLIEKLADAGVRVAIGHTAADPQTIRDAAAAGATLSTHLGNGAHAILPRHPNYIWEQLASDDLWASVIADGYHLPAAVLKTMVRAKTPERLILTSDAVSLGGLLPGTYAGGRYAVEESGRVVTAGTPYLAGAGFLQDTNIAFATRHTDLTLRQAILCATQNPARFLDLPEYGRLTTFGTRADLTLFRFPKEAQRLEIVQTIRLGRTIYQKP